MWILYVLMAYLFVYIVRSVKGPSVWDRILGMGLASTKIILIIVVYSSYQNDSNFLDFAIIYALMGFIGTIFIALFITERIIAAKKTKEEEK